MRQYSQTNFTRLRPKHVSELSCAGGGGWGDPYDRDPSLVEHDCIRGLVSAEGAKRYGVVINNGKVDNEATKKLRESLKNDRGEVELFNRGGTIDEIKAKAIEETNLEPPVSP